MMALAVAMPMTMAMAAISPAFAQSAGPPAPVAAKTSPADQAIDFYRKRDAPRAAPARCRRGGADDMITVCGVSEGARAPLPNDQGIRDGARTAKGEMQSTAGIHYTNPVGIMPQTGVGVALKGGKLSANGLGQ
jgi:hypothetical protein